MLRIASLLMAAVAVHSYSIYSNLDCYGGLNGFNGLNGLSACNPAPISCAPVSFLPAAAPAPTIACAPACPCPAQGNIVALLKAMTSAGLINPGTGTGTDNASLLSLQVLGLLKAAIGGTPGNGTVTDPALINLEVLPGLLTLLTNLLGGNTPATPVANSDILLKLLLALATDSCPAKCPCPTLPIALPAACPAPAIAACC